MKAGLIFIDGENKLYIAKNGQLSEYIESQGTTENDKNTYFEEITVKELKIYSDVSNMTIDSPSLKFKINEYLAISVDN